MRTNEESMKKVRKGYSCFKLTPESKSYILSRFPPLFDTTKCDHVTYQFGCSKDDPLPQKSTVQVVGYCCEDGIECLVVTVNGTVLRRDGKIYHITLSLDKELYKPKDSNMIIEKYGWEDLDERLNIESYPKFI